jgi:hypothetical protein
MRSVGKIFKQMECIMRKRVFLNVLLVLSLSLFLGACGGGGSDDGGSDGGGSGRCGFVFVDNDLFFTWVYTGINPPLDLVINGSGFHNAYNVFSQNYNEFSNGLISIDADGNVVLDYNDFDVVTRVDHTLYGTMSCDKTQMVYTRHVFAYDEPGGLTGDVPISETFTR